MSADFVAEDPVLWDVKLRRLANNFGRFEGLYSAFEKSGNFVQQHNVTFQNTRVFSNSIIWNKQPTIQITNHPTNQPTNQATNQPTNQPTNQHDQTDQTDQPTNQPTNQPINQARANFNPLPTCTVSRH